MAATYNGDDYALALPLSGHPEQVRDIARAFAALRAEHDSRVTDLLDANNRFEQRARDAERELKRVREGGPVTVNVYNAPRNTTANVELKRSDDGSAQIDISLHEYVEPRCTGGQVVTQSPCEHCGVTDEETCQMVVRS